MSTIDGVGKLAVWKSSNPSRPFKLHPNENTSLSSVTKNVVFIPHSAYMTKKFDIC